MKKEHIDKLANETLEYIADQFSKGEAVVRYSTCDTTDFGWDPVKHRALMQLRSRGVKGVIIKCYVKFEVTEWEIRQMDCGEEYSLPTAGVVK